MTMKTFIISMSLLIPVQSFSIRPDIGTDFEWDQNVLRREQMEHQNKLLERQLEHRDLKCVSFGVIIGTGLTLGLLGIRKLWYSKSNDSETIHKNNNITK